jgi:HPt (histidine-containing phosphotransfer) domain-containing protein
MIEADVKPSNNRISGPPLAPSSSPSGVAIDLAHLARMTLGEKSLEAEVLGLFDRQAGLLLARMRKSPPSAVGAFAHTLKGSALGIGAWQVADAAAVVEQAAKGAPAADLADVLDRLADAIGQAQSAILELRRVRATAD